MFIPKLQIQANHTIEISGSKSISNRILVLEKLFGNMYINNLSDSEDTKALKEALESTEEIVDIGHAGTAMRFLTAYFAIQEGRTTVLTGSERMQKRPIHPLVEALQDLGAEITYLKEFGFPPLKIVGKKIIKSNVKISAGISSQFITALLLIGGKLHNGLQIELEGKVTSKPYLQMTLKMLTEIGIDHEFHNDTLKVFRKEVTQTRTSICNFDVESDWSSASYFYSMCAIGRQNINLKSFKTNSLQGDSVLKEMYWDFFGVNTISDGGENTISLFPENVQFPKKVIINMQDYPDLAQTLCVTCVSLKIPFEIYGLHTLKIKETDRLKALHEELKKIGCVTKITDHSITSAAYVNVEEPIQISTYEDHRMAMSFAPFCLLHPITIENPEVVKKSYPRFWIDFLSILQPAKD